MIKNLKVRTKILILALVLIIFMGIMAAVSIVETTRGNNSHADLLKSTLYNDYDSLIQAEVKSVVSYLDTVYAAYQSGELTLEQAKKLRLTQFDN